ncbi:MAG: TMEM175 family protein, partial [Planctomycetota bacterium]
MNEQTLKERDIRHLRRLETVMDVVFAIVIWRLFMLLPQPSGDEGMLRSFASYFAEQTEVIAMVAIGLALVTIYWMQNNYVFGHLARTNGRHATLSLLQIFSLLLFLYSIRVGISFDGQFDAL